MSRTRFRFYTIACLTMAFAATGCLNSDPVAPECSGPIQIDAPENVTEGNTFTATAIHLGDGCLSNLAWTVEGVVSLLEASGSEAQFLAEAPGLATIRVSNPQGSRGELEVEVDEAEPGAP